VAKSRKTSSSTEPIAGLTPEQWKHHMHTDEDWTERLEGASEASVREVVAALEHADAEVRGLACNMVYAVGVEALGEHAVNAVARLHALSQEDRNAKVRNRARIVHEGIAGELERIQIRRELPWLAAFSEDALPRAAAAIDDTRDAVRLQVYLWWANATAIPAAMRTEVADKIAARAERETDEVTRRAAQLAHAHVRAG
jgi:hypothetical protein